SMTHKLLSAALVFAFTALAPCAWAQPTECARPAAAAGASGDAPTQNTPPPSPISIINQAPYNKSAFTFAYSGPCSPPMTLLGWDANKVTQSNSLRPFVLTLPSILGGGGKGDAVALDIATAWLIIPQDSRRSYSYAQASEWRRRVLRTHAGVAAYEG